MPIRIDSPKNPRIKAIARLRSNRDRKKSGLILIDGAREVARAIAAGLEIDEAFVCPEWCDDVNAKDCIQVIDRTGCNVIHLSPNAAEALSYGERQSPIVAIARRPERDLSALALPDSPLVAVLERIEKPGNLGAMLRSADAAGLDGVVMMDSACDPFGPNVIRASVGNIFRDFVAEATGENTIEWLRATGLRPVVSMPTAERLYDEVDWRIPSAIVLGSEAHGVTELWSQLDMACEFVRLPMRGQTDSLNVSTTAAVLFYEARRQRRSSN